MIGRDRGLAGAVFRRTLQLGVVAYVVWTAATGIWRNYKVAHNNPRLVGLMHGDGWETAYKTNEDVLSLFGKSYDASLDFLGMPWAATVGGLATADPILALSIFVSNLGWSWGLLASALVAVFLAVFLGKVFCSHLCPMRLSFEIGQWIRGGLLRLGVPLPRFRAQASVGGWVLAGGLAASTFAGLGVWFFLLPYLSLSASIFLGITAGGVAGIVSVPAVLWLVDMLLAPGAFCRSLCPQGFLLETLGQRSLLRLEKKATPCPGPCRACSMACPYGLNPREGTHRPACDNCGRCVSICPTNALQRRFRLPIVMGALLVAMVPTGAEAHHNKGLPHYGYYENYPQVPTEEVIIIDGRWEMGATIFNFQGYERKDANSPNDVKIFAYLYDLEADEPYLGAVTFDIVLDGEVVSSFVRERVDEEVVYSTRETLPKSGEYELVARIPGAEIAPSLPFDIDLDEDDIAWGLLLGLGGALIPLFLLAALGRSRRGRSQLLREQPTAEGA